MTEHWFNKLFNALTERRRDFIWSGILLILSLWTTYSFLWTMTLISDHSQTYWEKALTIFPELLLLLGTTVSIGAIVFFFTTGMMALTQYVD